jgi:hypothetical protein
MKKNKQQRIILIIAAFLFVFLVGGFLYIDSLLDSRIEEFTSKITGPSVDGKIGFLVNAKILDGDKLVDVIVYRNSVEINYKETHFVFMDTKNIYKSTNGSELVEVTHDISNGYIVLYGNPTRGINGGFDSHKWYIRIFNHDGTLVFERNDIADPNGYYLMSNGSEFVYDVLTCRGLEKFKLQFLSVTKKSSVETKYYETLFDIDSSVKKEC